MRLVLAIAACAVVSFAAVAPCRADDPPPPATSVDLTTSSYGFSPGSVYGPWQFTTLQLRSVVGNDKPGLLFVTQTDHDGGAAESGTNFLLDDYHDWTPRFFTYVAAGAASGTIFPTRSANVEGNWNVHDGLVMGLGYGLYVNPDRTVQHFVSVGPTWYFNGGDVTLRYEPFWDFGYGGVPTYTFALTLGTEGLARRPVMKLEMQQGVEPQFAVNAPGTVTPFNNRTFVADLLGQYWIDSHFAYQFGFDYARQIDVATHATVYTRRGLTGGFIFGIGRANKPPF